MVIREGLTLEQDTKACLDMLCLCGELGGVGGNEAYRTYLRRLIDAVILQRREIERLRSVLISANNNWRHDFSQEVEAAADKLFKKLAAHRTDPFNRRNSELVAHAEGAAE